MTTHPRRHLFEGEGSIIILLYIAKNQKATKREIERDLPVAQTAIDNTVERLKNAGLIKEEKQEKFPFSKILSPTEKGKAVAYYLAAIDNILEAEE